MNSSDYESKMLDLLSSSSYKILSKNPINSIMNLVTKAIKTSSLEPSLQQWLIPHTPQTPKIYGQPIIHKLGVPLRPIVSAIGPPTHALGRYLSSKLKRYVVSSPSYIKDSVDFILKTKDIQVDDQDILVIFDILSLFTKIPVPEAIDLISKLVDSETLNLVKLCLIHFLFLQRYCL